MKFIFPQNYNFKNKLFGFIDYSTLIFNLLYGGFTFCILDLIIKNFSIKISLFIILYFPLLIFSITGFNHENIVYVIIYLFKYFCNKKIYFYSKE
jgi:hypothetical protein